MDWEVTGQSWGARARDWATYQESLSLNSILEVLSHTKVGRGTKVLDIGCGSGLAVQESVKRGADGAGVDASEALLAIARERVPQGHFVRSPMDELPFEDETFDVGTSFNGLQFGGEQAFPEAVRVLKSGGTLAMSFWTDFGDFEEYFTILQSYSRPGAKLPAKYKKPGVAEEKFAELGLKGIERVVTAVEVEYEDGESAYRGLVSAGPAVMAIDYAGEVEVRIALEEYLKKFTNRESGRVRLGGTFSNVFGSRP